MTRLLGEYLRENCDLTCQQIVMGLRQQVIRRDGGTPALIGEVLVSMGYVTAEQLAFALEQQRYETSTLAGPHRQPASDIPAYL